MMIKQDIISLVTGVYMWFNQISDPSVSFEKKDLERYFTPDFVMNMNNEVITKDYESLFYHFEKFRNSGSILLVHLPVKEMVVSDDLQKCVVRYTITKKKLDNNSENYEVIAIWHISTDGRLQRMNEVVYVELKTK